MPTERAGPVAGIVLAAGTSSRLGRNKILLELGDQPVVRRAVAGAIDAGLSPVLVVLGFEVDRARDALVGLPYEPVLNPDYHTGINRSVQLGLARVPPDVVAAVIVLADMPLVTAGMIASVVERYRESDAPLVVSDYGGVLAPPTLYDRSLFCELTAGEGEGCGRHVVRRHRHEAVALEMPPDALLDLDVPEDYERLKMHFTETVG